MKKCTEVNCFVHEGESCVLGEMDKNKCKNFNNSEDRSEVVSEEKSTLLANIPWSGSTFGLSDLVLLTPRTRSIVIGVIGVHDAGKTTLLLGNYLNCIQGNPIADAEFAGSWTLGAWEALAAWSRFDDAARLPSFPPHTPRGSARLPGLLHLALRRKDKSIRDILLTDAPGEWFSSWAINENSPSAEGAQWTIRNADAFLVFADCERLNGVQRGEARKDLRQMIERLGGYVQDRPVTLIWAKSDIISLQEIKPQIRESIQKALKDNIPHASEMETSHKNIASFTNALSVILDKIWMPKYAKMITEPILSDSPFFAFRGYHEQS